MMNKFVDNDRIQIIHWSDKTKDHILENKGKGKASGTVLCGKKFRWSNQWILPIDFQAPNVLVHEMVFHEKWREYNFCKECLKRSNLREKWCWMT